MKFSDLDELARHDETTAERATHDRRRAELRAAPRAGIAIRNAREEAGLTQTELAARIGIAQSALSRVKRAEPTSPSERSSASPKHSAYRYTSR